MARSWAHALRGSGSACGKSSSRTAPASIRKRHSALACAWVVDATAPQRRRQDRQRQHRRGGGVATRLMQQRRQHVAGGAGALDGGILTRLLLCPMGGGSTPPNGLCTGGPRQGAGQLAGGALRAALRGLNLRQQRGERGPGGTAVQGQVPAPFVPTALRKVKSCRPLATSPASTSALTSSGIARCRGRALRVARGRARPAAGCRCR